MRVHTAITHAHSRTHSQIHIGHTPSQFFFVGFFPLYVLLSWIEWEHYASESLSFTSRWLIRLLMWPTYTSLLLQVWDNAWAFDKEAPSTDPENHGNAHAHSRVRLRGRSRDPCHGAWLTNAHAYGP
jgi:DNA-binding transcriptional regulator of glucitol operon